MSHLVYALTTEGAGDVVSIHTKLQEGGFKKDVDRSQSQTPCRDVYVKHFPGTPQGECVVYATLGNLYVNGKYDKGYIQFVGDFNASEDPNIRTPSQLPTHISDSTTLDQVLEMLGIVPKPE